MGSLEEEVPTQNTIADNTPDFNSISGTSFLALPRWIVPPILLSSFDVGRSDAMRHNFIQILGDPGPMRSPEANATNQLLRNGIVRDDLDIARNGLRPYMAQVSCSLQDINGQNIGKWIKLVSEYITGGHMLLSGTLQSRGIQSPICPGDNLEIDNTVFHIESVAHTCGISPDGRKFFMTQIALTNGISASPISSNAGLYSGITPEGLRTFEPGQTHETIYQDNKDTNIKDGKKGDIPPDAEEKNPIPDNPYWEPGK
jgi:hypothetical protein